MHRRSKFYLIFKAMTAFSLLFHKSKFDDVCVGFTDDFFSSFSSGGTLHSFSVDCMQLSVVLWIKAPYPQRSIKCLMVLKRTALYLVIRPNYLFINLLVFIYLFIIQFHFKPQTELIVWAYQKSHNWNCWLHRLICLFFLSTECHMEKCAVLMLCR